MPSEYPKPPFPSQKQPMPGSTGKMDPRPDHGEESYKGSGKLKGLKAIITGGDSGTGNGTVTFSVAPSTVSVQRTGAFTVAGKTFTVTQAVNNCSYVLTPTNTTIAAGGGSGSFTVTTAAGCAWAATSNQTWIKPSGSGTGSGTVNFTVAANTGSTSRVGAIAIGTQVFTISQGAGTATQPTPTSR